MPKHIEAKIVSLCAASIPPISKVESDSAYPSSFASSKTSLKFFPDRSISVRI